MVAADGFRVYFKQAEMSPDYVWRWLLTSVNTVKKTFSVGRWYRVWNWVSVKCGF